MDDTSTSKSKEEVIAELQQLRALLHEHNIPVPTSFAHTPTHSTSPTTSKKRKHEAKSAQKRHHQPQFSGSDEHSEEVEIAHTHLIPVEGNDSNTAQSTNSQHPFLYNDI
jgi:hypothetical protein